MGHLPLQQSRQLFALSVEVFLSLLGWLPIICSSLFPSNSTFNLTGYSNLILPPLSSYSFCPETSCLLLNIPAYNNIGDSQYCQ
jgi:exopolysaccharide biosynthesis predicted pyruvyltransferase EpsI